MADVSITPASVVANSNATRTSGSAGESITAGQAVYFDTTVNKWKLADADSGTIGANHATGIALNAAALNQPVSVQTSGDITVGGTLVPGTAYYLSKNAGGVCTVSDLTTGSYVCQLGLARSTTAMALNVRFPGVVLVSITPPTSFAIGILPGNAISTPNINVGSHAALQWERTQPWTVNLQSQVFSKPTAIPPGGGGAFAVIYTTCNQGSGTTFPGYEVVINATGHLQVRLISNVGTGNLIDVSGSTMVCDGISHNIAVSYDGLSLAAGVKIYVDGALETNTVNTDALTGSIINTQPLVIGNQLGFPFALGGILSSFQLSNIVRSQAYCAAYTTPVVDANTVLAYNFSEGSGTTTADLSSNGFTGTINAGWPGQPQCVQFILDTDNTASRTSTVATLPKAVASGNTVIASFICAGGGTLTITDNKGNTYPAPTINNTAGSGLQFQIFVLPNVTNGPTVFTATLSAAGTFLRLRVDEISGVAASPIDVSTSAHQATPGTGTDAISSGSVTTTGNGDFIFGLNGFASDTTLVPGTGFISLGGNGTDGIGAEYKIQSVAGVIAATYTRSTAGQATTAIIALKHA